MRRRLPRPGGWFALAALLATIAGIATLSAAASRGGTVDVVVAAVDIPAGTVLDDDTGTLSVRRIASGASLPGMLRSVDEARGRAIAVPVAAGEPVTQATLGGSPGTAPAPLSPGERAVSVPLAAAGAAAPALVPGVSVDVVATSPDGAGDARVVVSAAEVLATTRAPGTDPATDAGAVLLRTGQRDALRLSAALDRAGVRLLPRPFEGDAP